MAAGSVVMRDEHAIREVERLAHAGLPATDLLRRAARALARSVPFDVWSAATIDPASGLITDAVAEVWRAGDGEPRPVNTAWFEHFYFEEALDRTAELVRSGLVATTIHEQTGGKLDLSLCYREAMKPNGVAHKLNAVFADRVLWGDLELYRSNGSPAFSERELALVRRAAPHVAAGLRAATLQAQTQIDGLSVVEDGEGAPGVLMIDGRGGVSATPAGGRLLADLGAAPASPLRAARDLPVPVHVVLNALGRSLAPAADADRHRVPSLRVRGRSGRWLTLHASAAEGVEGQGGQTVVVIAPARPADVAWIGLTAHGLSPREEEVVKLVVGGLSTRQMADKLFIAEHTVQRHLSNVFEKVGVRSRRELVKGLFVEQMMPGVVARSAA
jgi:DNA-binding CsgD family transcriptional regulator